MSHSIDDFLNRFPEFSTITDKTIIQRFLDDAEAEIDLEKCPSIAHLLQFNYAAHALTKSSFNPEGIDDGIGMITNKSVDGVSESRDSGLPSKSTYTDIWFKSTPYGVQYLRLRRKCFSGGLVAP